MADLAITAANVATLSGKNHSKAGTAGGTITAGMPVRVDSQNRIVPSANTSAANADVDGIALNGASDGQPVTYQESGNINLGAATAVGKIYVLSTAGLISPVDDVASGDFITTIGVGITAANVKLGLCPSGVAAAADVA